VISQKALEVLQARGEDKPRATSNEQRATRKKTAAEDEEE